MVVGKVALVNFTNFWTITSFHSLYHEKIPKVLISPEFPIIDQNTAYLKLEMNNPNKAHLKNDISLFIFLNDQVEKKGIWVQYKLSILSSDKTEMLSYQNTCLLSKSVGNGDPHYFIKKKELMYNLKDKLLPDGKLTIISKITIIDHIVNVQFEQCSKNINNLFQNKHFADVALSVDGKEIHVHKAILASKSSVFYTMFTHNTNKNLVIEISDIDYNVLLELVRFIYTNNVKNFHNISKDLLIAANKYGINDLKDMCENHFICSVKLDNAAEVLIFAELHNASHLKMYIQNLINENVKEFIKTPEFLCLKKSHSPLLLEILCMAIEKLS